MSRRRQHLNLVGPQVRRIRDAQKWSQEVLAAKLQRAGWDLERSGVGKIEAQLVRVREIDLYYLATALGVKLLDLLPPSSQLEPGKDVHSQIQSRLRRNPADKTATEEPYKKGKKSKSG